MDSSTDWVTSTLYSPSKARAHQAQAKDWEAVDAWLSKKYATRRIPVFERNDETLPALLALAELNEAADDQRVHVDRIEKNVLATTSKRASEEGEIYRSVAAAVDKDENLALLAQTIVYLDCAIVDMTAISSAILDLTSQSFIAHQQAMQVESQIAALVLEQQRLAEQLKNLQRDSFKTPTVLSEQTSEHLRNSKHMKAKLAEYGDRLNGLHSFDRSQQQVSSLIQDSDDLDTILHRINTTEAELELYQNLPTDARAARDRVRNVKEQLVKLIRRRDELFENLAGP